MITSRWHPGRRRAGRTSRQKNYRVLIVASIIILNSCSTPASECEQLSIDHSISTQAIVVPSTTPRIVSMVQHSLNIKCVSPGTLESGAMIPTSFIARLVNQALARLDSTTPSFTPTLDLAGDGRSPPTEIPSGKE